MKKTATYIMLSFLFHLLTSQLVLAEIREVDHYYFKLWLDCDRNSAIKFQYTLWADSGNNPRPSSFYEDPTVPASCEQQTTASYASVRSGWDRGHLVMSNHMDFSATAMLRANYMTNIMPQRSTMNQGAWLATEEIAECYRELSDIEIIGGPLWEGGPLNSYFLNSHGVYTPRAYWKVLITRDYDGNATNAIAWIIPNDTTATRSNINNFLVSVSEVESRSGQSISLPNSFRYSVPSTSWSMPSGCDLS